MRITPISVAMFDAQGHLSLSPPTLYGFAEAHPVRLVNDLLLAGTPAAFDQYHGYCDFLDAVAQRLGVHPRNISIRGSSQLGYSIAPKPKVWTAMSVQSDIDLCIVDAPYFHRLDDDVQRWEETNRADLFQGLDFDNFVGRRQDRFFNCCRDYRIPKVICVHHHDTMSGIEVERFCGLRRALSAFVFRDWWSVRRRYEYDLRELVKGVRARRLPEPPDMPFDAG